MLPEFYLGSLYFKYLAQKLHGFQAIYLKSQHANVILIKWLMYVNLSSTLIELVNYNKEQTSSWSHSGIEEPWRAMYWGWSRVWSQPKHATHKNHCLKKYHLFTLENMNVKACNLVPFISSCTYHVKFKINVKMISAQHSSNNGKN